MDFEIPDKIKVITDMINEFVDKELIPLEPEFVTKEFRNMVPVLEEKRNMVRQMELWGPNHPKEHGGMGLEPGGAWPRFRSPGPDSPRALRVRLPGPGRRQYRDPPPSRHAGAEGEIPEAPGGGKDPELLLHDRGGHAGIEPGHDGNHGGQGRRRLRHQRPQVVHHGRRRLEVRHRHGGDQSRGADVPAGEHDHRALRHARLQPGAQHPGHGPSRQRLRQPRRDTLPELPRAAEEPPGHGRAWLRHRPGAARTRADPPLHALARHLQPLLRPHVHAGQRSGSSRRAARPWPRGRSSRPGWPNPRPRYRRRGS